MDSSLSFVNVNKQNRPRIIDMSTLDRSKFWKYCTIAEKKKNPSL